MKISRLLSLILLILISLTFVSCDKNGEDPTNGDNSKPAVTLPSTEEVKLVSKDEVIYINMLGNGTIESMKATNRITNSLFSYYREFGQFHQQNNLNITSPKGTILIDNECALIPSLQQNDNMFYSLSLDEKYYQTKLPFNIKINYKLDGKDIEYKDLKGVSGKLEMTYDFKPNLDADDYFLNSFAAQIQIPFNINYAKNIVAEGAMQSTLVGQTATIIYMIMPNTTQTFTIYLDAFNFTFEGMQAVLQPFSINTLTSFLPFDLTAEINFEDLENYVNINLDDFNNFENSITLFSNFNNALEMFNDLDDLFDLLDIIPDLDILEDPSIYNPSYLGKMSEIVTIKRTIDYYIAGFGPFQILLEDLQLKLDIFMDKYGNDFSKVEQIITQITLLEQLLTSLNIEDDFTIISFIENSNTYLPLIENVVTNIKSIRENLNAIIKSFYFLANDLEPIVKDLIDVLLVLESLPDFYEQFNDLGLKLGLGKMYGWYDPEEEDQIDLLLLELRGLKEYQESFVIDESIIDLLNNVIELYEVNSEKNIRNIDSLILQILEINEDLTTPKDGKLGLYNIINVFDVLLQFSDYLPNNSYEIVSFLDNKNEKPNSIQFIIKQRGI